MFFKNIASWHWAELALGEILTHHLSHVPLVKIIRNAHLLSHQVRLHFAFAAERSNCLCVESVCAWWVFVRVFNSNTRGVMSKPQRALSGRPLGCVHSTHTQQMVNSRTIRSGSPSTERVRAGGSSNTQHFHTGLMLMLRAWCGCGLFILQPQDGVWPRKHLIVRDFQLNRHPDQARALLCWTLDDKHEITALKIKMKSLFFSI